MTKTTKLRIAICGGAAVIVVIVLLLLTRGCAKPKASPEAKPGDIVITTAVIAITGPATGETPVTTAPAKGSNYTCGEVSWSPNDSIFRGGTVYTASVTLTANENHTFTNELTATINDRKANITNNRGRQVTVSVQFDATLAKMVTGITLVAQPSKLFYAHGDKLDLSGLVIKLVYEDDETENVSSADFASKDITTNPGNGITLAHTMHDNIPVTISCGRENVDTHNITVNRAAPAVTWPAGLSATFDQTLSDIPLGSFSNSIPGVFRWSTPSSSVGTLGTRAHRMTFTPNDTVNYTAVTANVNITVRLGVVTVPIPAGTFTMGSPDTETGRYPDETQYQVRLNGFNMLKYEVTQGQFEMVMGKTPSSFTSNAAAGENQLRRPVELVSWYDALTFCNKLSILEGLTPAYSIGGKTNPDEWGAVPTGFDATWNNVVIVAGSNGYRLPTEAQWEYACRAGTTTSWHSGEQFEVLEEYAWIVSNSGGRTHEVGRKKPNAWGLHDMHGNVAEWCWDWYGGAYPGGTQNNPMGASSGTFRVVRGGGWNGSMQIVRSAYRGYPSPYNRSNFLGFRVIRP